MRLVRTSALPLLIAALFAPAITAAAHAQSAPAGIWQGYDGEWEHTSSQLIALAEATPPEKFAWRPASGVRSTSEVYMHIVIHANEHMGQLVAYARMTGVVPPWSQ
jgi:uncharacterized damage-inducible protein DinB